MMSSSLSRSLSRVRLPDMIKERRKNNTCRVCTNNKIKTHDKVIQEIGREFDPNRVKRSLGLIHLQTCGEEAQDKQTTYGFIETRGKIVKKNFKEMKISRVGDLHTAAKRHRREVITKGNRPAKGIKGFVESGEDRNRIKT